MTWGGSTTTAVGTSAATADTANWNLATFTVEFATPNITVTSYYNGIVDTVGAAEDVTAFGAFAD
eukprot:CAMPEP_0168314570 /NCGR_PEP_ID=MMETSP0210-20121227/9014_1 /TAXON_ID=40633 /ORGANISM="Condylostoma magnum, Strain COL2" /LENGTH=64 /DNA_ID=CAMNT_0008284141 /DNA_START=647 /DNA_END=841 /DNA_ORIENTATION=+